MVRYAVVRSAMVIPVMVGASLLVFLAAFALPGDPIRALGGTRVLPESTIEALTARYNLDQPLPVQYVSYMGNLLRGDLGESIASRRSINSILASSLPVSLRLAAATIVVETIIGVAAGVMAALRRKSFLDTLVLVSTTIAVAIPTFVLAFLLQYLLGVRWRLLPVAGLSSWQGYLLPAFVLAAVSLAYVARLTRTSLVETLGQDYVRTAQSKGLSRRRILVRHALRNALLPVVTFIGIDLGFLIGGAVVVEAVFNLDGIGLALFRAISQRDNLVVVGITMVLTFAFVMVNLVVDLLYAVLDPRIRFD